MPTRGDYLRTAVEMDESSLSEDEYAEIDAETDGGDDEDYTRVYRRGDSAPSPPSATLPPRPALEQLARQHLIRGR